MNPLPPALPAAVPTRGTLALFVAAVALPTLLAFNLPPSPTLFNQLAALALWGWVVAVSAFHAPASEGSPSTGPLLSAHAVMGACVVWSWWAGSLPAGLALSALGLLAASALMVWAGSRAHSAALHAFLVAWIVAGVLGTGIGVVQVFAPEWTDGQWIARTGLVGRAVGNLRQPNHLSSVLLWSAVAVVPLLQSGRLSRRLGIGLFALMVFGITLTGSRTGGVGIVVLALWGVLDRRLARSTRMLLLSAPVLYGLTWLVMWAWAEATAHTFGAAQRLGEGDLSGSRFAIWRDTLVLVARHPWFGVGFGEFNFAWTLTPFPDRALAFFDHTHNLPLQLLVELGVPLALLVMGLLAAALWTAWRRAWAVEDEGAFARSSFVMVLLMALHSQLEYPLWYAYFLLPAAWLWGWCLAQGGRALTPDLSRPREREKKWLAMGGVALVLGSAAGLADYLRVVQIFAPGAGAGPLADRIEDGQRSLFFAHHADYAAVTTAQQPETVAGGFDRAPHYLLDTRLMTAWARALEAQGDDDRARHLAARLQEFRNPAADAFFAPCAEAASKPFQCEPPQRTPHWREYLPTEPR